MAINIICIIIVTFTTVVDGLAEVYRCYRPPGYPCAKHTLTCGIERHISILNLRYFTKPSTVTCPYLQGEDDCKTSVCCKYGRGDKDTILNRQDTLLVHKMCSYQQSCSFNSPYSPSTGYDYIGYNFLCIPGSEMDYIMNTTTFTTTRGRRYLYLSHKLTPTHGLTCSCNITGNHVLLRRYIYLSDESCHSVTITSGTHTLHTCNGEDVFIQSRSVSVSEVIGTSIKFTSYTSNPDDVIWIIYGHLNDDGRVSCDCSNQVLVDGEGSGNIDCNLKECPGNKLPWILFGVSSTLLVVTVCAIIWCIIKRVRRRRGNQPPNPASDPTNNASPTPDAVYYSDALTINPLNQNDDDDEIHYDTIS